MTGETLAAHKLNRDDLAAKNVLLLHIAEVRIHGFAPIAEAELDALGANDRAVAWFAMVEAKPADTASIAKPVRFAVSGIERSLRASKPIVSDNKPAFFRAPIFLNELRSAPPADHWRVYALKGEEMAASACELDEAYLRNAKPELLPDSGLDPKLDICLVAREQFKAEILNSTWTFEPRYYASRWFIAAP